MIARLVQRLENLIFGRRGATLALLAVVTVVMGVFAARLHMDAGFDKQLPSGHEYTDTFFKYRETLFGANRLMVVVHARKGDIWNVPFLRKLNDVTKAVLYMPGVDRRTVSSLWTPNTRVLQITEEGFQARDVIGGDVTPEKLDDKRIVQIRENVVTGGYIGSLVATDGSGAMVIADLLDMDPQTKARTDYIELGKRLETEIRAKFEDADVEIQIIGFAKQISDIAEGAKTVAIFFVLAFVLTALAVFWYCRSVVFTFVTLVCSLVSLVWQFGTLKLLGYGLDPLAVLVPFLVFAIGVSHGVQQVNYISREMCAGKSSYDAARSSFSGLLIPGTMALVTAFVGFATLVLIPIPMIRELAITASIGVAYKIVTNLIMLPVLASYFKLADDYVPRIDTLRARREEVIAVLDRVAEKRVAFVVVGIGLVVFALAWWQSQGRHIGYLKPGAPELREDARYNRDAVAIVERFGLGLDVLTIVNEVPEEGCYDFGRMTYIDRFAWHMANQEGVTSVASLPGLVKVGASGFNEGNLKWAALPRDKRSMASFIGLVGEGSGLYDPRCTVLPINVYLTDHKAMTLKSVIDAAKQYREANKFDTVTVRLASGNAGVQAATNEVLERTELPMMLYVYGTIVLLVLFTYRDWRAMVACCVPLTVATFLGYWFMKTLDIGLTVATLPVMVLAVGIGVDYAFYIYNRLQLHLAHGVAIEPAFKAALLETGNATIFTAITLSVGVATWAFSDLKFQADMGLLLAFMFTINMVMAITLLPALAVVIDTLIPRRGPVRAPTLSH
ncbi:RND family transporter [Ideonella sp. A 288]|uniref:efflux RND transporter permease subunit n=1 Tax=Ideonella sp. A 288 TaxID=1962181 RepID=UPI000B4BA6C8|nr:MMPL family transporter [Ideonella sp. A 288]